MTDRTRQTVPVTVANTGKTDYLYTGKESQNALFGINWYNSGARFQTTDGIFTSIDPLAEKYYYLSPYAYCAGNPIDTKRVAKAAGIGAATGLVGAALNVGTKAASATVEKTIEKKQASSTVKDTYRNEIKHELRSEGKQVKGSTLNKKVEELVKTNCEAEKSFVGFLRGVGSYSVQKTSNSVVEEVITY